MAANSKGRLFYGAMREPRSNDAPLPAEEAPPSRCAKCNSTDLARAHHRDLIACILLHERDEQTSARRAGEHLHWQCRECGDDFTSDCKGYDQ